MTKNRINLKFKASITGLAGNPFGQSVYKEQVASKINPNERITIVFPEQVEDIAISFIQGFFKEIIDHYGYDKLREMIEVEAGNEFVVKKIWENIY